MTLYPHEICDNCGREECWCVEWSIVRPYIALGSLIGLVWVVVLVVMYG